MNNQPTVKVDPFMEIFSKILFGFERCPPKTQKRMINQAIKEAGKYHNQVVADLEKLKVDYLELNDELLNCKENNDGL